MATSGPDLASLDPLFECPVCLDPFKDPRILPSCGHHFCCGCLEGLAAAHPHDSIICPTCRAVTELPAGTGVLSLPKPVTVNELQVALAGLQGRAGLDVLGDTTPLSPRGPTSRVCDPCGSHPAAFYCYQCKETLCEACHLTHTQASVFSGHQTADIDTVVFCRVHPSQPTTAYCQDCNVTICTRCVMGAHAKHRMDDMKTAAASRRETLQDVLKQRVALTVDKSLIACVEEKTGYIKQGYTESRQKISAAKDLVKDWSRKLRALEGELEARYNENMGKLGEFKSSIKAFGKQNTRLVELANHLVTEGGDTEVLTRGKDISPPEPFRDTLSLRVPSLGDSPVKLCKSLSGIMESLQINYHTETIGGVVMRRQVSAAEAPSVRPKTLNRRSLSPETSAAIAEQRASVGIHLPVSLPTSPVSRDTDMVNLPEGWESMKGVGKGKKKNVLVVNVRPGTSENSTVLKRLLATSDGKVTGILRIERVQNLNLYTEYLATKDRLRATHGSITELRLWCEANLTTIKRVNKHGFADTGGGPVQFSVRASHQCTYEAPAKTTGQKYLYCVLVVVGKAVKEGNPRGEGTYDSLVDTEHSPSVYSVMNHSQAYPEYLITYTGKTVFDIT